MPPPGSLNYEVFGPRRSPAVLFLHGFMGSSDDWRDVVTAVGDRRFCIAPDLPGHGSSLELTPESYTIEESARAVVRVLDELGVGRSVVVGYSMGGRLALYLALRYPERCAGLYLESASPGIESEEEREARRMSDEKRAQRLESGDFEAFLQDWYRQPLFESLARDEGLLGRTIAARRRNEPAELARSLRGMGTGRQPSLWGDLGSLYVPALAVAGDLDEKYSRISSRMARISPRVRSTAVKDAGHTVHAEAPAAFISLLVDFLAGLSPGLGKAEPVT